MIIKMGMYLPVYLHDSAYNNDERHMYSSDTKFIFELNNIQFKNSTQKMTTSGLEICS